MLRYEQSVKNVYNELNSCIILGLTGRTGSGCTTVANILKTENFEQLNLHAPKRRDFKNKEERKDAIVYNFVKNNKWIPFVTIEVSSVILSFIFERSYDSFRDFIINLSANNTKRFRISGETELLEKIEGLKNLFGNEKYKDVDTNLLEILTKEEKIVEYYEYYTNIINRNKQSLYNVLKDYSCYESTKSNFYDFKEKKSYFYTYLMQLFGNNIRSSSNPYESNFDQQSFLTVTKRVSNIIQIICKYNEINPNANKETRICIDALRNPYESYYLKDRFKSFYLVSVSTDDDERRRRLSNLDANELISLDEMEYPAKEYESGQLFYQQSIADCLQISDIHLYNPHSQNERYEMLVSNLVRYIALMLHPGLIPPTDIERCMQAAFNAKFNSGCLSRQVGAAITDDKYYVKAIGWNDVPQGQIPCNLRSLQNYFSESEKATFSEFELQNFDFKTTLEKINKLFLPLENGSFVDNYNISYCFKDIYNGINKDKNQVYTRSLHAEENAFLQISKFGGQGIIGGKLFVTASPCELCSKKSYQLGIRDIYYIDPYPGIAASHVLKLGDSDRNPRLNLFYGVIGKAYVSLYMQRFALKDELQLISGINTKEAAKDKSLIKQLKTEDVKYKSIELSLIFNSRHDIEFIQKVTLIPQKELKSFQKSLSWSGSSYEKTVINEQTDAYEIIDEPSNNGMCYYSVIPKSPLCKDKEFTYNTKTILRDISSIMNPIFSYHVTAPTANLKMNLKIGKEAFEDENIIKNVRINKYANIDKNIIFDTNTIKPSCESEQYIEYSKTFRKPYLYYVYSIEWDFKN